MLVLSSIAFIVGNGIGTGLGYGCGLYLDAYERRVGQRVFPDGLARLTFHGLQGLLMRLEVAVR